MYPVPCHDTTSYGPSDKTWPVDEQIAVFTKAMEEISAPELGVEVFLNWGAQVNDNCFVAMYNDTAQKRGGCPTPFYEVARKFNQMTRRRLASGVEDAGAARADARADS